MSSRWYPIFRRGNPQLRVFLPNFTMKLVKPRYSTPSNVVTFEVPVIMTDHDIKNYLEKIYKVPVANVKSRIQMGELYLDKLHKDVNKEDDYRVAEITLKHGHTFTFPTIIDEEQELEEHNKQAKQIQEVEKIHKQYAKRDKKHFRPDVPGWFGL